MLDGPVVSSSCGEDRPCTVVAGDKGGSNEVDNGVSAALGVDGDTGGENGGIGDHVVVIVLGRPSRTLGST